MYPSRPVPRTSARTRRRGRRLHIAVAAALAALVAAIGLPAASATGSTPTRDAALTSTQTQVAATSFDHRALTAPEADFDRVAKTATPDGIRAIVGLQTAFIPEGYLGAGEVASQRAAIATARTQLLGGLARTTFTVLRTYESIPSVALLLSPPAFDALRRSGNVAAISDDPVLKATLSQTTPVVEATEAWQFGRTGAGQAIAVLDSGIEKTHSFLTQANGASKVIAEACFASTANGVGGNCPNNAATQTGNGAGLPCTYVAPVSKCDHGTHVAGIAAGHGYGSITYSGVARDANLVSIRTMTSGAIGFNSDTVTGLAHVYALATGSNPLPIAVANVSLGTDTTYGNCDAWYSSTKTAIDNLASIGIPTVIASGNSGSRTGVSAPACISTAVTVGATNQVGTPTEVAAQFSNSSAQIDLLAPGSIVTSSVTGNAFGAKTGTSMAAPHVAGAWAILEQMQPGGQIPAFLTHLQQTGKPVSDQGNPAVIKPRIRILAASVQVADTGFVDANTYTGSGDWGLVSNGVGLATRTSGSSGPLSGPITISGIPSGSVIVAAYLYWMTLGGPDPSVDLNGPRTGTLVGASQNTCWPGVNQLGPNRVYRAALPTGVVTGNGTYTVGGVGGSNGIDAQGASIVVVYKQVAVNKKFRSGAHVAKSDRKSKRQEN